MNDSSNISSVKWSELYELLPLVHKRPYLFLTDKSISALQNFLNGYLPSLYHQENGNEILIDFNNFKFATLKRYEHHNDKKNEFRSVLLKETNQNEEEAFELFFRLLAEWRL